MRLPRLHLAHQGRAKDRCGDNKCQTISTQTLQSIHWALLALACSSRAKSRSSWHWPLHPFCIFAKEQQNFAMLERFLGMRQCWIRKSQLLRSQLLQPLARNQSQTRCEMLPVQTKGTVASSRRQWVHRDPPIVQSDCNSAWCDSPGYSTQNDLHSIEGLPVELATGEETGCSYIDAQCAEEEY